MKMIVLNGAPRSGKDTMLLMLEQAVTEGLIPKHYLIPFSYKRTLCRSVAIRYGLDEQMVWDLNANTLTKDLPDERFGGKSVRQALIYESEDVIKKELGETGVALQTFEDIKEIHSLYSLRHKVLVTPDGGFKSEMNESCNQFDIERKDILLIRMLRDGCTFDGDSRGYIPNPDLVIENNGTIEDLKKHLPTILQFMDAENNHMPEDTLRSLSDMFHKRIHLDKATYIPTDVDDWGAFTKSLQLCVDKFGYVEVNEYGSYQLSRAGLMYCRNSGDLRARHIAYENMAIEVKPCHYITRLSDFVDKETWDSLDDKQKVVLMQDFEKHARTNIPVAVIQSRWIDANRNLHDYL